MASLTANDQPRIWIQKNYRSFNGIRGLAVLAVYCSHALWIAPVFQLAHLANFGFLGVDLFFVLSGFLITGILFDVVNERDYFRNFYIRRSLRIFPLFYGIYLVLCICRIFLPTDFDGYVPAFVLYVGNLFAPKLHHGVENLNVMRLWTGGRWHTVVSMGHFWSLCVEEQFYLVWPAVVFFLRDRRRLMRLCCVGILVGPAIRLLLWARFPQLAEETSFIYFSTYTRFDSLLVGGFLALYLRGRMLSRNQLRRISTWLLLVPGLMALAGGMRGYSKWHFGDSPFTGTVGYSLIALACAGLLLRSLDDSTKTSAFFRNTFLARLGVVSYGFYVIHGLPGIWIHDIEEPVHLWLHGQHLLRMLIFVGWFALSWLLAEISFRFFEQRFLRLKDRLAPERKKTRLEMQPQDATS